MALFLGLLFTLPGLALVVVGAFWWTTYLRSFSWVEVPGTITKNELITKTSKRSGGTAGDSYSYENDVSYDYVFEGKSYTGERVSAMWGGSGGSNHHEWRDELQPYFLNGEPYPILVNPHNPSEAMIFREVTMSMVALLPIGFLFFIPGAFLLSLIPRMAKEERMKREGKTPWDKEGLWLNGAEVYNPFHSCLKNAALALWLACFVFAGMAVFLEVSLTVIIILCFVLLIPGLPSLGLWWEALKHLREAKRHGRISLQFDEFPVARGATMCARLLSERPLRADLLDCTITCEQTTTQVKRGEQIEHKKIVLNESFQRPVLDGGSASDEGFAVVITFEIPHDAPLRERFDKRNSVEWKLAIKSATPGVLIDASYQIPVYTTKAQGNATSV